MKNKIKLLAILTATVALVGCGTTEQYKMYAETQKSIAQANAMAETARYAALAEIAKTGDPGARVAAVMSINFGAQGGNGPRVQQVAPPKSFGDTALQWTSVLLPSLTNIYGITANRQVAVTQSNNQASVAKSTNETFANISGQGFTAVTNVANAGIAQVGTTAAAGLTAVTTVNTNSNAAITNVANAANDSIKAVADVVPQIQPNVTTTTNTTTTTTNNTVAP
jgi:hypothetical protein